MLFVAFIERRQRGRSRVEDSWRTCMTVTVTVGRGCACEQAEMSQGLLNTLHDMLCEVSSAGQ